MRDPQVTDGRGPPWPSHSLSRRAELLRARTRLSVIWDGLQQLQPSAYERQSAAADMAKQVARLLAELATIVSQLMATCDELTECDSPSAEIDRELMSEARVLADTCFMALAEANERHNDLLRLSGTADWEQVLSRCAGALRRARKGVSSVDAQLARTLRERPSIDVGAQLEESLETRRIFSVLRRTAEGAGRPDTAQIRPRLRAVELRIALLSEKELYLRLRLEDRRELQSLQKRIHAWLAAPDDELSGLRLWQDAVGFTQLLAQVNLRQELREHDQQLVEAALTRIEPSPAALVDEAVWSSLRALLGLNDELDDLLRRNDRTRAGCLPILRALADALRPSKLMALPTAGGQDW